MSDTNRNEPSSFDFSDSDGAADAASDQFTETTTKGWGQRIAESIKGVLVGIVLIIVSMIGLFWNEGRAVQTARSLSEGAGLLVQGSSARVDPGNEGKLVHISGDARATGPIMDTEFGISLPALKLVRMAEMYQWEEETRTETRKKVGGSEETTTTYNYVRTWSDKPIDSGRFRHPEGHANPQMRYRQRDVVARTADLGAFRLDERVLQQLPATTEVRLDAKVVDRIRDRVGPSAAITGDHIYLGLDWGQLRADGRPVAAPDPARPRIGDQRISYRAALPGPVSVIGRQTGSDFSPYPTQAGDALLMVRPGLMSATAMFDVAQSQNTMMTWLVRGGGALLMFLGFGMILKPLVVVADVVPLIGDILGAGAGLVSLVLTMILAPLVVAVAWVWYRPVISLSVLAVSALGIAGWMFLANRRRLALKPGAA